MSTSKQTKAKATFEVKTWDEKPYSELDGGAKFTRVNVTVSIHGDIEGEGTLEYLMFYPGDGSASIVGLEHVIGQIGDRAGSFVLQHTGTDDGSTTRSTYFVVPAPALASCAVFEAKAVRCCPGTSHSILCRSTMTSNNDAQRTALTNSAPSNRPFSLEIASA